MLFCDSNDPFWGVGELFGAYENFPAAILEAEIPFLSERGGQSHSPCSTDLISSPRLHNNVDDGFMNPLAAGKRAVFCPQVLLHPLLREHIYKYPLRRVSPQQDKVYQYRAPALFNRNSKNGPTNTKFGPSLPLGLHIAHSHTYTMSKLQLKMHDS